MRTFVTLFIMLMVGIGITVNAQPVSTLGVISTNGVKAAVPVYASNFTDVQTFQLYIHYDQSIATPVAGFNLITSGAISGVSGSLGWSNPAPGVIKVTWYSLDLPVCKTIPGNPVLFYVNFTRAAFGTSVLSFDDSDDSYCKYTCGAGTYADDPASTYYVSGSLTFINAAPVTTISSISACPTMNVSVPVTVTGFNNVGIVSLTINYPTSNLTFVSGTNTSSFPGLTFNLASAGTITIGGTASVTDGFSLTDGSTFFTLNFTYTGGTPAITWYDDGESCEYTGPSNYNLPDGYPVMTDGPSNYVNGSVSPSTAKYWTGGTNTTWGTAGNWCGGVPTSSVDAFIPTVTTAGRMPVIGATNTAECYNLTLESNATLTINSNATRSGSLKVFGNATGPGKVIYNRQFKNYDADGNVFDWHYFSSPVGNVTEISETKISNIYPWEETTGAWGTALANKTQLESGRGYNLDQDDDISDGMIAFTGSVVTSTSVTTTSPYTTNYNTGAYEEYLSRVARTPFGAGGWNLLGNPFTSAMSVAAFLETNDGDGTVATNKFDPNYVAVYIYDGDVAPNGQYLYRGKASPFVEPITGDTDPENAEYSSDNIQTGQGFFVLAQKNGVDFTFNQSMQVHAGTILLKSAFKDTELPGLKLKLRQGTTESSAVVYYNNNVTTGLDPGYDIGQLSTGPDVEIYTALVSQDKGVNFAQQALPLSGAEGFVVPVGVDAQKGGEVTFSALTRPIGSGTFYLEDKITGTITDLSKNSYKVTLPEKTAGTGRFFIHSSLATGIQPIVTNNELGVRIWSNDHTVNIEGTVSNKATGEIYDLLGRRLLQTRLDDTQFNTITVPSSMRGVYLVKVADGGKIRTEKVVF